MRKRATDPVADVFAPVVGKAAWLVKRAYAGNLYLEFGEPHLQIYEARPSTAKSDLQLQILRRRQVIVEGDWHLWIHHCHWSFRQGATEVANADSSDAQIDLAASALDGQILVSVANDPGSAATQFTFDLGGVLETRATPGAPMADTWLLFMRGGQVFAMRADGRYSWEPASTAPDDTVWFPLPR